VTPHVPLKLQVLDRVCTEHLVLPLTRGSIHFAHPGIMKRRSQITEGYKETHRREIGKKKCQKWRQNKLINQQHHDFMIAQFCKQEIYGM
jgi:hypothetical protein